MADFQRYWHGDQEEPQFLLEVYRDREESRRRRFSLAAGVLAEACLVLVAVYVPAGGGRGDAAPLSVNVRNSIPLVAPRLDQFQLTQKEPQRAKPASEVNMAALLPKPQIIQPRQMPPGRPFVPPPSAAEEQRAAPVIEAPKVEASTQGVPNLPGAPTAGLPTAPPPNSLKNPFERVTTPDIPSPTDRAPGQKALTPGKTSLEDVAKAAMRTGGKGMIVGDVGAGSGGVSEGIFQTPTPARNASTLELLSDSQGVDFRPYLVQVLAAVKKNWMAVLPESARFGRQGRVAVQFAIDRAGKVPKLVIAVPSGTEALDRAAVAGISASNPFPPLPADFKGGEIRLQLVFSYNMPR